MADDDRHELENFLDELQDLQVEARRCEQELDSFELTLSIQHAAAEISDFTYHIRCQQISRSRQTLYNALQKLQTQRTKILRMLYSN